MNKTIVLFGILLLSCGDTGNSIERQIYASSSIVECHKNIKGKGHQYHKGYGWGHHKCKPEVEVPVCYQWILVCKEIDCKEKCWWKKVKISCPQEEDGGLPQQDFSTSEPDAGIQKDALVSIDDTNQGLDSNETKDNGNSQEDGALSSDLFVDDPDSSISLHPIPWPGHENKKIFIPKPQDTPSQEEELAIAGGCSISGMNKTNKVPPIFGFLFMIGVLVTMLVVSKFFKSKAAAGVAAFLTIALLSGMVYAFPTQKLELPAGKFDYLQTEDPRLSPSFGLKLFYNYENNPLRLINKPDNDTVYRLIKERHSLHVLGSFTLMKKIQLGFDIPVILDQSYSSQLNLLNKDFAEGGLGNLRVMTKVLLLDTKWIDLAGYAHLGLPTSTAEFIGEKNGHLTLGLSTGTQFGPVDLALNTGFRLRSDETFSKNNFQIQDIDQQFTFSLGGRWKIVDYKEGGLSALFDIHGSLGLNKDITQEEVPLEVLFGLETRIFKAFNLTAAAGIGTTRGLGIPESRVLIGMSWTFEKCSVCNKNNQIIKEVIKWKTKIVYKKKIVPVFVQIPVIVDLPSVYFKTNSTEINEEGKGQLLALAKGLKNHPGIITTIRVEGHADYRGNTKYNTNLAYRRAESVKNYMEEQGIETKFESATYGELAPMYRGKDKKDLGKNRRVDLRAVFP